MPIATSFKISGLLIQKEGRVNSKNAKLKSTRTLILIKKEIKRLFMKENCLALYMKANIIKGIP